MNSQTIMISSADILAAGDKRNLLWLYRDMLRSRRTDEKMAGIVRQREAFFHISSVGHEGVAVLNRFLVPSDWLHCHYRDKALMLARGVSVQTLFHGFFCNAKSSSAGRRLGDMASDPARHIVSMVTSVGNQALPSVGLAMAIKQGTDNPIVYCGLGDGGTQQGEVLEAIAEAVRSELPVLFWIEDNGLSISTRTARQTFFDLPSGFAKEFYGLRVNRLNGRDVLSCLDDVGQIIQSMRQTRRPALVVFEVDRLASHSHADDERLYRSEDELRKSQDQGDPIQILKGHLLRMGCTESELRSVNAAISEEIDAAATIARHTPDPTSEAVTQSPLPAVETGNREYRGDPSASCLTMRDAIRETLCQHLATNPKVSLLGQDIEDPKGDVFGLTIGLSSAFPGRVINSALTESTIIGTSIGRALAGERPVAFVQFADFLPNSFNQIHSELATMSWRSNGGWICPVVIIAPCGGYSPGLGPFHSQTFESSLAHIPGIDVFMPSTAADAAGLLNAAFQSDRPSIHLIPKVCLNTRQEMTSTDVPEQLVPIGSARRVESGNDLTIVAWGSTLPLCHKAVRDLRQADVAVDLIDLRSISPWDRDMVCDSVRHTRKLLVVHEDNITCGFGAEVVATVTEHVFVPFRAQRIARLDTHIPCNFSSQLEVLPSYQRILTEAARMLDLEVSWDLPAAVNDEAILLKAEGLSPTDRTLIVMDWKIQPGETVREGQHLAEFESDKSVFDYMSPCAGTVQEILAQEGDCVSVGQPILRLVQQTASALFPRKRSRNEEPGVPRLSRREVRTARISKAPQRRSYATVAISPPSVALGTECLTNRDLVSRFPQVTEEDIVSRTGIERRYQLGSGQSLVRIASEAAKKALETQRVSVGHIDAVICSTTTPPQTTPSTACQLLFELCRDGDLREIPAFDVNAACTGYLYALTSAYDHLQQYPDHAVLVVTAEALSTVVDRNEFDTAVLFGDAATATVLFGPEHARQPAMRLHRPVVSSKPDGGALIRVPTPGCGYLEMDGKRVFSQAVRQMIFSLERCCAHAEVALDSLSLIVPHQANERIIDAIRRRLPNGTCRVFSHVRDYGNTSSSSIPLALAECLEKEQLKGSIGLCAFGGGLTFGGAVLTL